MNTTGTATGTVGLVRAGISSYIVTISGISGNGMLGITVAKDTAFDLAGNMATEATSATFTVDNAVPTVTIGAPSRAITETTPVTYTVTYSDANFSASTLSADDISLNKTGTADGTVSVTGSGTSYTVTIGDITGDGTLSITLTAGTASDALGHQAPVATSGVFTVGDPPPTVTISNPSCTLTASTSVAYTVTYFDANFSASTLSTDDISLNATGTATGTVSLTGSGISYIVTISGIAGDGTLGITLAAGTASDATGHLALTATSATFEVDNTAPAVTIGAPSSTLTGSASVTYTVTYTDANFSASKLSAGDISLNATGMATGTIGVTGSGTSYIVTISGIAGDGTLGITLAAGTASDSAGNTSAAATSATFEVDNTIPTVAISAPSRTLTASTPVTYTVTYTDASFSASTLSAGNIALNATGTAAGSVAVTGSGTTYTVTISGITGDGTLGITLAAGTACDSLGNLTAAATSATFGVDNATPAPDVTIGRASWQANPATGSTIYFTAAFTESVSDFTAADVTLTGTAPGTLAATVTPVGSDGKTYTIAVTGIIGSGTVLATVGGGVAHNAAGKENTASTGADNTVTMAIPTISNVMVKSTNSAANTTITWKATDVAAITQTALTIDGVAVTFTKTGTAYSASKKLAAGSHTYNITVTNANGVSTVDTETFNVAATIPTITNVQTTATTSAKATKITWKASDIDGIGSVALVIDGMAGTVVKQSGGGNSGVYRLPAS